MVERDDGDGVAGAAVVAGAAAAAGMVGRDDGVAGAAVVAGAAAGLFSYHLTPAGPHHLLRQPWSAHRHVWRAPPSKPSSANAGISGIGR